MTVTYTFVGCLIITFYTMVNADNKCQAECLNGLTKLSIDNKRARNIDFAKTFEDFVNIKWINNYDVNSLMCLYL